MKLALALALALAGSLAADDAPALKLPPEVRAKPAEIAELKAETAGKVVRWVPLTPGLSLRPIDGGRVLLFSGPAGRYELLAYTAVGDVPSEPARVVVLIEAPEPPLPPKPPPDDRLKKKLDAALKAERAAARADVAQLAAIYREAVRVSADPEIASMRDLLARIRQVSATLIGPDALPLVRGAVAEELLAALGMTGDEPLTPSARSKAADVFGRLSVTLEELSK